MKLIMPLAGLAILMLGLGACQPTLFGMAESRFRALTPIQQEQVIAAYNKQQEK